MIIDTHSHCYWDTLEPRIDDIITTMRQYQVEKAIQIGCDTITSKEAIDLARRFPGVFFATVWLHPETAQHESHIEWERWSWIEEFDVLITQNRDIVVAIGECGLDFHYLDGSDNGKQKVDLNNLSKRAQAQIENQKFWWLEQWKLAQKHNLPLVIHTRDARDATIDFIKKHNINRCVMHCYSEDLDMARELMAFSDTIYFSFSGILTYKNAQKIQETAVSIPLDRILIETDAPFLAPQPVRGQVCEPAYTSYVLDKLVELRSEWREVIEATVYNNSRKCFGI